jgi:hypothetical protein
MLPQPALFRAGLQASVPEEGREEMGLAFRED